MSDENSNETADTSVALLQEEGKSSGPRPAYGSIHLNDKNKRRRAETPAPSKVVKRAWSAKKGKLSLKAFARSLNTEESKEWFNNKSGKQERLGKQARLENRGASIRAVANASKLARRKTKNSG